jgi:hypothetical protein
MTERRDLDFALDAAAVNGDDLDAARRVLLDRLTRHSNDFAATTALRALTRYSGEVQADAPTDARVRTAGLSGVDRLRRSHVNGAS